MDVAYCALSLVKTIPIELDTMNKNTPLMEYEIKKPILALITAISTLHIAWHQSSINDPSAKMGRNSVIEPVIFCVWLCVPKDFVSFKSNVICHI